MVFDNIFDVTKVGGEWLCKGDRQLYQLQVSSSGRIGYTTEKKAPLKTSYDFDTNDLNNDESCESDVNDLSYECNHLPARRHYNSTAIAAKLSIKDKMSTRKAAKVCKSIAEEGINIPTPSQYGVWKKVMAQSNLMKEKIKKVVKKELSASILTGRNGR